MDFVGVGKVKPTIRAAFLRDLALRPAPPVCGVRLRHARIAGPLDLTYTQLRALVLEDCEIADPIDLSHARLDALSLERSRFSHLLARAAVIDGPFDFSDAGPVDAVAWIDASKARISGGITGLRARLKIPAPRPQTEVKLWDMSTPCGCRKPKSAATCGSPIGSWRTAVSASTTRIFTAACR